MKRMLPLAFTLYLLLCGCMSRTENRGVEKIGGVVVGDSRENDSSLGAFLEANGYSVGCKNINGDSNE